MHITVLSGNTSTELSGNITIKSDGRITALNNRAVFEPVYDEITATLKPAVNTINGVSPNEKGEFFLSGSECTSWEMLPDEHGLTLVDLCPACKDCESLYRLKQEVERLKMWLTLLKDVNLYTDFGSRNQINLLWLKRLEQKPECGEYILNGAQPPKYEDTYDNFYNTEAFTKSLQLIQQYMTTVHMWNYIVSRNNMSDVVQAAPEDTSGFAVQTKRALTSCNDNQAIRCIIKVVSADVLYDATDDSDPVIASLVSLAGSYPVSMFIPRAVLRFEPFTEHTIVQLQPASINLPVIPSTPDADGITANIDIIDATASDEYCYCRSVDTGIKAAKAAGTYVVDAKFLPFVYSVMEDANGDPISVRGGTVYSDDFWKTTTGGTISFQFFSTNTPPVPVTRPTAKEYLDSKTAPTCSVNFRIIWTISVKWFVYANLTDQNPKVEENTYKFIANGVRKYYSSAIIGGSEIIEGSTTTQVTNA